MAERSNRFNATQEAVQETALRVSQQQLLDAQLLELGDDDLLQRVEDELNENGALEEGRDEEDDEFPSDDPSDLSDKEREEDLSYYYDDEELPVYTPGGGDNEQAEIPVGDTRSFVDDLRAQVPEHGIADEKQAELVDYLIGSLNDNGFIDRPLSSISDDLLFHHNIDASVEEIERALHILQRFDPPGIGARDLQECMSIQLQRKMEEAADSKNLERIFVLGLAKEVVENHFNLFRRNEQDKLRKALDVDADSLAEALEALSRLNPRPGLALSEGTDGRSQAIVPDFIIETSLDGDITMTLRGSRIPQLHVNPTYKSMLEAADRKNMTQAQKDDLKYVRSNVERAQGFILALKKRQDTLYRIMKAIIEAQREFMLTQDEMTLKPLTGGEIAKTVGVDGSTVSRAVSSRYALLDGTIYPLRAFFMRTKRNAEGEEVLRTQVVNAIQEIIDEEDKSNPLSDSAISQILISRGLNIRRRTVAKYRDQMGVPTAPLRRKF